MLAISQAIRHATSQDINRPKPPPITLNVLTKTLVVRTMSRLDNDQVGCLDYDWVLTKTLVVRTVSRPEGN